MATETTVQSWGSRLGSSFSGILIGFVLILIAIGVLFWNEKRTVSTAKALKEGSANAVSVESKAVDPANDGKLVCVSGDVSTDEILTDTQFGVSVGAIKLNRKVEMYQWKEESETKTERVSGGSEKKTTVYSYQKIWTDSPIDSSSFNETGYDNPGSFPFESQSFVAKDVKLGAFQLSADLIDRLGPEEAFDPAKLNAETPAATPEDAATSENLNAPQPTETPVAASENLNAPQSTETPVAAPENVAVEAPADLSVAADTTISTDVSISVDPTAPTAANAVASLVADPDPKTPKPVANGFYIGVDPLSPQVGDVRITFSIVSAPRQATVASQQNGESFVPYQAKTGKVELLANKIVSVEQIFTDAQSSNSTTAWILRIVGFVVMFIGFNSVFKPIAVLADILPFLGTIANVGTSIVSFAFSLAGSLTTIAVAWLYYRPFVGIPLLILAVGSLIWLFSKGKKVKNGATS